MTQPIYEGTWEEIASIASELTGRRVRLTVLDLTHLRRRKDTA
jgi:hypothetical protein